MRTKARTKRGIKVKKAITKMSEEKQGGRSGAWKSFWNRYCNL